MSGYVSHQAFHRLEWDLTQHLQRIKASSHSIQKILHEKRPLLLTSFKVELLTTRIMWHLLSMLYSKTNYTKSVLIDIWIAFL